VRFNSILSGLLILGCSKAAVQSAPRTSPDSAEQAAAPTGRELIPAEWTVYEDTAPTGEVTTASLQLPAAKDIDGLERNDAPRLILRCLDGKVSAFIDLQAPDSGLTQLDSLATDSQVAIQLDSAPACE
jgi:hypothetical protein